MPDLEPVGQSLPPPSNPERRKPGSRKSPKPRPRDPEPEPEPGQAARREPRESGHIDEYA